MRNNIFAAFVMVVLLCEAAFADVSIVENFPDDAFRSYVSANFDTDSDGTLSDTEIAAVVRIPATMTYSYNTSDHTLTTSELVLALAEVRDFTGIEYFSELEALHCGGLKYRTLLNLASNDKLICVKCEAIDLQSLDLSGHTALQYVHCSSIWLESLDVSGCENLVYLNCQNNSISSLDLSDSSSLDSLNCSVNNLPRLNLSENTELAITDCVSQSITGGYVTRIAPSSGYNWEFSFSGIIPSGEFSRITSVTAYDSDSAEITTAQYASGVYRLASVPSSIVYFYDTELVYMDVTVTSIDVHEKFPPVIITDSLPKGKRGVFYSAVITASGDVPMSWDVQVLPSALSYDAQTSGDRLTISGIPEVWGSFDVTVRVSNDISSDARTFLLEIVSPDGLPLSDFGDLSKDVESYDNDPEDEHLDENERKRITSLPPGLGYDYPPVSNIRPSGIRWPIGGGGGGGTGIFGYFPNLQRLRITGSWSGSSWPGKGNGSGGATTPIDLTGNTELEVLIIENVHLGTIDLTKNTKLRILILINCGLTALNLSRNTALEYLDCSYNYLRTLDLSVNISLRYIYIHHNSLPHVNLQPNTAVITAQCHSQDLTGVLQDSGNTTNPYQFDLRVLPVSDANIENVVQGTIRAYDSSGGTVNVTWNNGVLRFPKVVSRVVYYYRTGRGDILLEVRITLTYSGRGPVTPPSTTRTPPTITTTSITPVFPFTLRASGSTPITWTIVSGTLPSGLSMNSSGVITGTATQTGTFTFKVRATNSEGYDEQTFTITITSLPGSNTGPVITTTSPLPYGATNSEYSLQLEASGSTPLSWSLFSGSLPPGLRLTSSGLLTGIPTATGTFTFVVLVQNAHGEHRKEFKLTIGAGTGTTSDDTGTGTGTGTGQDGVKPDITAIYTLTNGYIGVWYSTTLYAEGTRAISWRLTSGSLPAGLTLNANGTVTGTPTAAGEYIFTVEAVNSWGNDAATFRITVYTDEGQCCNNQSYDVSTGLVYEYTRNISSLTEYELAMLPSDIYIIAYVLPRFRVVRAGTYRFTVNLYNTVPAGLTLVWFPFAVYGTGGGTAHFWDYRGVQEITLSPDNRKLIVSVYLDVDTYAPVIAVLRPSEPESGDTVVQVGGGGGGGCSAVAGMQMLLAAGSMLLFRKR